jgi:hypothetical protein
VYEHPCVAGTITCMYNWALDISGWLANVRKAGMFWERVLYLHLVVSCLQLTNSERQEDPF